MPKNWGLETSYSKPLRFVFARPDRPRLLDPSAVFAQGILLIDLALLWRALEERKWNGPASAFIALGLASLPGYCTFHLLGFAIVVMPVLVASALAFSARETLRRWFPRIIGVGIVSIALCLPLLVNILHRGRSFCMARWKDPLFIWIQSAPHRYGMQVVLGLAGWDVFGTQQSHGTSRAFPRKSPSASAFTKLLLAIFLFGALVSYFGVVDDFVSKFGQFVSLAGIVAFLSLEERPKWGTALMICGLIAPGLLMANAFRANVVLQKVDPVWRVLDQLADQTHEVVLYDMPLHVQWSRSVWLQHQPYNSRIQFLKPAEDVEEQEKVYISNPAQLDSLPPTKERLRNLMGGAQSYLLLRSGTAAPLGIRLYRSAAFSVDRVTVK